MDIDAKRMQRTVESWTVFCRVVHWLRPRPWACWALVHKAGRTNRLTDQVRLKGQESKHDRVEVGRQRRNKRDDGERHCGDVKNHLVLWFHGGLLSEWLGVVAKTARLRGARPHGERPLAADMSRDACCTFAALAVSKGDTRQGSSGTSSAALWQLGYV